MSDQERISPYNNNTKSRRQVMRTKKVSIRGLLADPIPNSRNENEKNCRGDSKENY